MSAAPARPGVRGLIDLEGLARATLEALLDAAEALLPHAHGGDALRTRRPGRSLCNLFFEPSTRTRCSFQLAAQRLGMDVVNIDLTTSSVKKGETELDTLLTLHAMGIDVFVVRHPRAGVVAELAGGAPGGVRIVNAGDGARAHPTQGLLDVMSLRQSKGADLSGLRVLIVGDIRHSRVARSDVAALRALGTGEITLCGPPALLPAPDDPLCSGVRCVEDFDAAIAGVDAVIMLRLQRERMDEGAVPSLDAYSAAYRLDAGRLARAAADAVVLHPGPINRGVEITAEVAEGPRSLILRQVANGVAVRMAVLDWLLRD